MNGDILYKNGAFVNPNIVRNSNKRRASHGQIKFEEKKKKKRKLEALKIDYDDVDDIFE